MADNDKLTKVNDSLAAISAAMLERINNGYGTLTSLEEKLLKMVSENNLVANDPEFLLDLCKYFRGSINVETKIILEFISSMKGGRRQLLDKVDDEPKKPQSEALKKLSEMSASEREALRVEIEKDGQDGQA